MLKISKLTDKKIVKLRNEMEKLYNNRAISMDIITTPEDIDAIVNFFKALKNKESATMSIFLALGIYSDLSADVESPFAKGVKKIISNRMMHSIIYETKPDFKQYTRKYLKAITSSKNFTTNYYAAELLEKQIIANLYKKK